MRLVRRAERKTLFVINRKMGDPEAGECHFENHLAQDFESIWRCMVLTRTCRAGPLSCPKIKASVPVVAPEFPDMSRV